MTAYVLTAIQYMGLLLFLILGFMRAYAALYSKEERRFMKNRMRRRFKNQNEAAKKKDESSEVTLLFREAYMPWMSTLRFSVIRVLGLALGALYFSMTSSFTVLILFIAFWLIATEPLFKYSAIRLFLGRRIKKINEKKESELFSLFAMLKTDLIGNAREEINVYYLLKDTLPYTHYIRPIVNQFMRNWRESPEKAGKSFEVALGGDTAQFMGDFLGKLHSMDRKNALTILEEQSDVFGHRRSEMLLQKAEIQRNQFYTFFFLSAFMVIGWFLWFMYELTSTSMNF